jgi:L-fuculose-phosphate aldolase
MGGDYSVGIQRPGLSATAASSILDGNQTEVQAMTTVPFDPRVGELLLRYARMVVARGYVHNSLGNIAIRVPHPGFEHGVVYVLHGTVPTSVGHNLNREILRLRPDINAVIHAHHDETISLFASGLVKEFRPLSLEFPYVMAMPPHVVPSHLDVENDVGPIQDFIAGTNAVLMENHGVTTLGRDVSEAYHRLNTLASEMRRVILAAHLAAVSGQAVHYLGRESVDWMYRYAESVIYPSRDPARRPEGGERKA